LFFLQAEDGIRDWSVTGVQTCALPICQVAVLRDSVERLAPAEVARSHLLRQFLPPERCRNRRARLRPDRVDRGDGLPMAILAVEIGRASCREREEVVGVAVPSSEQ